MKRLICILTALTCMVSFAACGSSDSSNSEKASSSSAAESSEASSEDEDDTTEGSTEASTKSKESTSASQKSTANTTSAAATDPDEDDTDSQSSEAATSASSAKTTDPEKPSSGAQTTTSSDEDFSSNEISDIFGFEKISVDNSGETVVINFPEQLFSTDDVSTGEVDDTSIEGMIKNLNGVEINKNAASGIVTIKMPKKEYEKLMEKVTDEFDKTLRDIVDDTNYKSVTDIKRNADFSQFDVYVTTKEEFEEECGGLFFLSLTLEFLLYYTLDGNSLVDAAASGNDIEDVLKITVHDKNGKTYSANEFH